MTKHTILMMPLMGTGLYMHGYIMHPDNDKHSVHAFMEMMVTEAEKRIGPMAAMFISTELRKQKQIDKVMKIIMEYPETAEMRAKAKELHYTAWVMTADHPNHAIMERMHDE